MLCLGPEGSGKTTLLYSLKIPNWKTMSQDLALLGKQGTRNWDPAYHYEELSGGSLGKYGVWDVPGSEAMVSMWPAFYRYIAVTAVLFVVDASAEATDTSDKDKAPEKAAMIQKAKRQMAFLLNEDELRNAAFVLILNTKATPNKDTNSKSERAHKGGDKAAAKKPVDPITTATTVGELLGAQDYKKNSSQKARFLQYTLECSQMKPSDPIWKEILQEIYKIYLCVGPGRFL